MQRGAAQPRAQLPPRTASLPSPLAGLKGRPPTRWARPSPGPGEGETAPTGQAHRAIRPHAAYLRQLRARVSQDHLQHVGNRLGVRDPGVHHVPQDCQEEVAPLLREEEAPKHLREGGKRCRSECPAGGAQLSSRGCSGARKRGRRWPPAPGQGPAAGAAPEGLQPWGVWRGEGAALWAEGGARGRGHGALALPATGACGGRDSWSCCTDAGLKPQESSSLRRGSRTPQPDRREAVPFPRTADAPVHPSKERSEGEACYRRLVSGLLGPKSASAFPLYW